MKITITKVERKDNLMVLKIEDDKTPPRSFNLEIDANISEEELWSHINSHYASLIQAETLPAPDVELEKKWKGKTRNELGREE